MILNHTLFNIGYEYVPDSESASITAGPSVGTYEDLTGPSGSEDDLLSDKPKAVVKKGKKKTFIPQESKEEELVKDAGSAPSFIVPLPQTVEISDGQQARYYKKCYTHFEPLINNRQKLRRFEVKVDSYPKATVRWYLNGHEIQPSKDFGLDNLEDGTSILTLTEVFPDDAGELVCEVHNEKGIATSTTQLNITGGQFFFFHYKSKHLLLTSSFSITFYFYFMI